MYKAFYYYLKKVRILFNFNGLLASRSYAKRNLLNKYCLLLSSFINKKFRSAFCMVLI